MRACNRWLLTLAAIASTGLGIAPGSSAQPQANPAPGTQVVLLGTGTPAVDPDRFGPATAIIANDTAYLIDAGAGIVRRAAAAARARSIRPLQAANLRIVFLTH